MVPETIIDMQKFLLTTATLFGALSVMIGAFGAHALQQMLEMYQRTDTFETAVKYQFYHTLALFMIGLLMFRVQDKLLGYAGLAMIAGIIIFSGSLYILSLTNTKAWGAVTPFGGVFMITGWVLLVIVIIRSL